MNIIFLYRPSGFGPKGPIDGFWPKGVQGISLFVLDKIVYQMGFYKEVCSQTLNIQSFCLLPQTIYL